MYRIEMAMTFDGITESQPLNPNLYETPHLPLAIAARLERKWAADPNQLGCVPWLLVLDLSTNQEVLLQDGPYAYWRPAPAPVCEGWDEDLPF